MVRKLVVSVRIIFIIEQSHVTSIVDLADPYLRGARTRPGSNEQYIPSHAARRQHACTPKAARRHRKCHRAKIPNWDSGSRAP